MRKPAFDDYVIAHPLAVPFWVVGFVYLFLNLSPQGFLGSLVVVLSSVLAPPVASVLDRDS